MDEAEAQIPHDRSAKHKEAVRERVFYRYMNPDDGEKVPTGKYADPATMKRR